MTSGLTTTTTTSALSRVTHTGTLKKRLKCMEHARTETSKTAIGEDRRDSETADVDQVGSVVASMGQQWCSAVSDAVEQGQRQCG